MALIKCRECEREISSEARTCPHCGCRTRERKKLKTWHKAMLAVIAVVLIIVTVIVVNNNAWKSAVSVKYVRYEHEKVEDGWDYEYVYEITNESKKTLKNVRAVIRVEAFFDTVEFKKHVDSLYIGETVEFTIDRKEIEDAFEKENANSDWISTVEIVKIIWD